MRKPVPRRFKMMARKPSLSKNPHFLVNTNPGESVSLQLKLTVLVKPLGENNC